MNQDIIDLKIQAAISHDYIDLSNLNLETVPEQLRNVRHLKKINLSSNNLKSLPDWFQELDNLEVLDLRNCDLIHLCNGFEKLRSLTSLYLRDNSFTEVPIQLKFMPNLKTVFLSKNTIEKFPDWFFSFENINIEGNPITDPPVELYHRGIEHVKNYFKERQKGTEILNEAKLLIVGEPNAGKTTLLNKIINEDFEVNIFQTSTKGIDIQALYFQTENNQNFRVNVWDFGGQEIYHATHQFFLTKRSLYILVSDNRAEDTDFNYWLQTIELLSDNSPIIIVQNEKQGRKKDISERGMREKFRTIKQISSFDIARNKQGLKTLLHSLKNEAINLPHIGTELPKIWVEIRKALEETAKEKPYITENEYYEICSKYGMPEKERANYLSDFLHDLGVFLHFKDNSILKRWIILKPEWGTEAVYKVLDDKQVINNKGYFTKKDLNILWNSEYYVDMHDELISLMKKFELCYQLEGEETHIAAQLLQRDKPAYSWDKEANLQVKYEYGFMPKGIITRFIVKMHYYITDQKLVWREGVVLERQNTKAEVIETYGEKEIQIKVSGKNKKEFLAVILDTLDKIHKSYSKIKVKKLIPCNCTVCIKNGSRFLFNYDEIRKFIDGNVLSDRCRESLKEVKLLPLIDDAFGNNLDSTSNGPLIYLSYSNLDKEYKTQFYKHFAALARTGNFRVFDKQEITAGTDEKQELRENIDVADVIIALVTANYLIDEWAINTEIPKAIDRSEAGSCLTIPVIISDCMLETLPLLKYKPITYKEKPIFTSQNIDEALTHVVYSIRDSIENFLSTRNTIAESFYNEALLSYQNKQD